ncbi:hypothetical protein [Oenococcus kitaharae]|uniref:Uncharacterized protein n=1 Tax=Oenococcus kitaharae DSM 17330 TaxID=1045004 RepID=G9WFY4_9LACO|nr:hypothetical protein [Oenococcus kitaharae]EHN59507.1 hypothetical protein OKIT_1424 [Oenococcus kitaharae DSM 17330]
MTEISSINPVENIRLSSELWKNNALEKLHLFRQKTVDIYDHCLIAQVNFTDRMKHNAQLAAIAQTPAPAFAAALPTAATSFSAFWARSAYFKNSLTNIARQINLFASWAAVQTQALSRTLALMGKNLAVQLEPAVRKQLSILDSFVNQNMMQPVVRAARHPIRILVVTLFTGLTIYIVITATQAFINGNW